MQKHAQAFRHFEYLVTLKPQWPSAYYGACLAAFKIGQYPLALSRIERAIELVEADAKDTKFRRGVSTREQHYETIKRETDEQQRLA